MASPRARSASRSDDGRRTFKPRDSHFGIGLDLLDMRERDFETAAERPELVEALDLKNGVIAFNL
jgi:hypothetical protein